MVRETMDQLSGASAIFQVPRVNWTAEALSAALAKVLVERRMLPAAFSAWSKSDLRLKQAKSIVEADGFPGMTFSWRSIPPGAMLAQIGGFHVQFDGRNDAAFSDGPWLTARISTNEMKRMDTAQARVVKEFFQTLAVALKPTFAAVDWWADGFAPFKNQNPRARAWGAMYLGADLATTIGRDRIARASGLLIRQAMPEGAMWLQVWENPFMVSDQHRLQIQEELGLH